MTNVEFAAALRDIASFYEGNAEMPQPVELPVFCWDAKRFQAALEALGRIGNAAIMRPDDEYWTTVDRAFGGFALSVKIPKREMGERRMVTKVVEVFAPSSELEAALAKLSLPIESPGATAETAPETQNVQTKEG